MRARREDFKQAATALARDVAGGPIEKWRPNVRLTATAYWFSAGADRLVVVVGDHERQPTVDSVLGFLLGVMGNGIADLVLPDGSEATTLRRLAFLTYPIRVWTHGDGDVREMIVPTRREVFSSYDDPLVLDVHDLGDRSALVADLVAWAETHPRLLPAHCRSYLSWQSQGRQVLQIERSGPSLKVTAGSRHEVGHRIEMVVGLDPLSPEQKASVRASVLQALTDRESHLDDANHEHRFQSKLFRSDTALGYRKMDPELPAQRAGRGFIDFFAVRDSGQMVVVETKRGPDRELVLQGLDYWIWATAHAKELAMHFGGDPEKPVLIDFVVDSRVHPAVSPYTAAQAESIDGCIPWRFRSVEWEDNGRPMIVNLPLREPPGQDARKPFNAPRLRPPRYRWAIGSHLTRNSPGPVTRGVFLKNPADGVVQAARHIWLDLEKRELVHTFGNHLRSSQVFGTNLFGPLDQDDAATLLHRWFSDVGSAESPEFEWTDPLDRLGETSGALDRQTQVDVLLRGTKTGGQRIAAFLEVKFTEDDYGSCAAYQSAPEPNRLVCRQPGPFGREPQRCWAINNKGTGGRRTYDLLLGDTTPFDGSGCWYRTSGYQPMRNLALATALLRDQELDEAVFVVCAPRARLDLRAGLARISTAVPGLSLGWLDAEDVLSLHRHPETASLARRYDLSTQWTTPS